MIVSQQVKYARAGTSPPWHTIVGGILHPPHNHLRQQIFRPGHDGSAAEEQAHIVEFQHVGFLAEPGGVVDARAVLLEGGVAARIFGDVGIDRYLVEGAASAAQGF